MRGQRHRSSTWSRRADWSAESPVLPHGDAQAGSEKRAGIFIGPEFGTVSRQDLVLAAREAGVDKIIVTGLSTPTDQVRLRMAQQLGADHVIDIDHHDLLETVADLTGGLMADLVIDCASGGTDSVTTAMQLARKRGRVILGGQKRQKIPHFDSDMIIARFLNVKGMRGHSYESVELAIGLIAHNRHHVQAMSTHSFGLDHTDLALRSLVGQGVEGAIHMTVHPQHAQLP